MWWRMRIVRLRAWLLACRSPESAGCLMCVKGFNQQAKAVGGSSGIHGLLCLNMSLCGLGNLHMRRHTLLLLLLLLLNR